jgi:hypothetical protein
VRRGSWTRLASRERSRALPWLALTAQAVVAVPVAVAAHLAL